MSYSERFHSIDATTRLVVCCSGSFWQIPKLHPVQMPNVPMVSKNMDEQLKLAQKVVSVVNQKTETVIILYSSTLWTSQKS